VLFILSLDTQQILCCLPTYWNMWEATYHFQLPQSRSQFYLKNPIQIFNFLESFFMIISSLAMNQRNMFLSTTEISWFFCWAFSHPSFYVIFPTLCGIPTYWNMWNTYLLEYVGFRPIGIYGIPAYWNMWIAYLPGGIYCL
jgi:hypothetical protein